MFLISGMRKQISEFNLGLVTTSRLLSLNYLFPTLIKSLKNTSIQLLLRKRKNQSFVWLIFSSILLYKFRQKHSWSLRRESNPWPLPYQGSALPTELRKHFLYCYIILYMFWRVNGKFVTFHWCFFIFPKLLLLVHHLISLLSYLLQICLNQRVLPLLHIVLWSIHITHLLFLVVQHLQN